jgi:hypothetical protein
MDWEKIINDSVNQIPAWMLTTLIGFASGIIFKWIADRSARIKPSRVLLDCKNPKELHIVIGAPWGIIPGTTELHQYDGMPIFGFGSLNAYHNIMQLFNTAYPKMKAFPLETSKSFDLKNIKHDLILIGFPLGNEVTAIVMDDLNLPIKFNGHDIIDSRTKNIEYQAKAQSKKIVADYGCIIHAPNPYNPDASVTIFAGCETFGVKAAAEFFGVHNLHLLHNLRWPRGFWLALLSGVIFRLNGTRYYQVIVSTQVRGLFTSEPTLVKYWKLKNVVKQLNS